MQVAMVIRAAESREALSYRQGATQPTLLAARDHNEPEESQAPDTTDDEQDDDTR
jgi:hypothetical protein